MKSKETLALGKSPLNSTLPGQVPSDQEKSISEGDQAKSVPFYDAIQKFFVEGFAVVCLKYN